MKNNYKERVTEFTTVFIVIIKVILVEPAFVDGRRNVHSFYVL